MSDPVALLCRLIAVDTHNPGGDERSLCAAARRRAARARRPCARRGPARGASTPTRSRPGARRGCCSTPTSTPCRSTPAGAAIRSPRASADGRVVGLGACDTKGSIAAILCALDAGAAARPGDRLHRRRGAHRHRHPRAPVDDERDALAGVRRAIVCEPTSCRAGTRHRGILWIEASISGRGGHSSRADELPAPLADAARLAVAFAEWGQRQREVGPLGFRGMCMNIAKLDGGVAFNVIPDEATLTISVRPPPGSDVDQVRDELYALALDVLPRAQLSAPMSNPSFHTREACRVLRRRSARRRRSISPSGPRRRCSPTPASTASSTARATSRRRTRPTSSCPSPSSSARATPSPPSWPPRC